MAITAKSRAQLALHARTKLPVQETIDLVRAATGAVRAAARAC